MNLMRLLKPNLWKSKLSIKFPTRKITIECSTTSNFAEYDKPIDINQINEFDEKKINHKCNTMSLIKLKPIMIQREYTFSLFSKKIFTVNCKMPLRRYPNDGFILRHIFIYPTILAISNIVLINAWYEHDLFIKDILFYLIIQGGVNLSIIGILLEQIIHVFYHPNESRRCNTYDEKFDRPIIVIDDFENQAPYRKLLCIFKHHKNLHFLITSNSTKFDKNKKNIEVFLNTYIGEHSQYWKNQNVEFYDASILNTMNKEERTKYVDELIKSTIYKYPVITSLNYNSNTIYDDSSKNCQNKNLNELHNTNLEIANLNFDEHRK